MREFVAVEVGGPGPWGHLRRTPQHLTLRFLGEVTAEQSAALPTLLAPVGDSVAPFELTVEGVGAFPTRAAPRVVWQGVSAGRAELEHLAGRVRAAVAPVFGEERGAFVPHLTLFRVRGPRDRQAALELLDGTRSAPPPWRGSVQEFVLKESLLGREGAVHRTLASFPLKGARAPTD